MLLYKTTPQWQQIYEFCNFGNDNEKKLRRETMFRYIFVTFTEDEVCKPLTRHPKLFLQDNWQISSW